MFCILFYLAWFNSFRSSQSALMSVLIREASKNFLFLKLGHCHRMPILIFPPCHCSHLMRKDLSDQTASKVLNFLPNSNLNLFSKLAFLIFLLSKALWNLHSCSKFPSFEFLGKWCVSTSSTNWILHCHSWFDAIGKLSVIWWWGVLHLLWMLALNFLGTSYQGVT